MSSAFHSLLALLIGMNHKHLIAENQFLKVENQILKNNLGKHHLVLKPDERSRLIRFGTELGTRVKDILSIVSYRTYQRWQKAKKDGVEMKKLGRPRTAKEICDLVVEMAKDNLYWGDLRIVGEMKKLGYTISASGVRSILRRSGMSPRPMDRGRQDEVYSELISRHMDTIVACDFLTKKIWIGFNKVSSLVFFWS